MLISQLDTDAESQTFQRDVVGTPMTLPNREDAQVFIRVSCRDILRVTAVVTIKVIMSEATVDVRIFVANNLEDDTFPEAEIIDTNVRKMPPMPRRITMT